MSCSALVLGSTATEMTGSGKVICSRTIGILLVAERVTGGGLAQSDRRRDVAGANLLDLLAMVGVHLEQAADALALALGCVVDVGAAAQHAAVDAEERELADEGIGRDLEGERRERLAVAGVAHRGGLAFGSSTLHRRAVERGRQEVDDRVEHRLDALVLQRRSAEDRDELGADRAGAKAANDLGGRQGLAVEVLDHQLVVGLGDRLEQVVPVLRDQLPHRSSGISERRSAGAEVVGVDDRLLGDEVDHAPELRLGADGELDGHRVRPETVLDGGHRSVEVRADPVHLVDEADARHLVAVSLPPHGLGLGLDARDGIEDRHRAVEHAQAPLDLDSEVHVPGRIDNVDSVAAPLGSRRRRGDGDPALLLLDHPVHGRGALVDLAHLVDAARVEQDAFGRRGLARVDVGHDPDVPGLLEGERARRHCNRHVSTGSARRLCSTRPSCGCLPSA